MCFIMQPSDALTGRPAAGQDLETAQAQRHRIIHCLLLINLISKTCWSQELKQEANMPLLLESIFYILLNSLLVQGSIYYVAEITCSPTEVISVPLLSIQSVQAGNVKFPCYQTFPKRCI